MRISRSMVFVIGMVALAAAALPGYTQMEHPRMDLGSALRAIRPLLRDDPERAIMMLKALRSQYPRQTRIYLLLGETYQVVGLPDSAEAAYEACLRFDPNNAPAAAALGVLYINEGNNKRARTVFDDLLTRTDHSVSTYRGIGAALSQAGYYDLALRMYENGRVRNEDSYVLTLDIAYLHTTLGDYESAIHEYLRLMETNPKQRRLAQKKLIDLVREREEDAQPLIDILAADAERDAPDRRYVQAVLAIIYLERDMFENALDMALRADQGRVTDGNVLFSLAQQAAAEYERKPLVLKRAHYDVTMRALEAYINDYSSAPLIPRAKLMQVDLWMDQLAGRVPGEHEPRASTMERAIGTLDWIMQSYPGSEFWEQAHLKKGDLLFEIDHNPQAAKLVYQSGERRARFHRLEFAERLAKVYLVLTEYGEARRHLDRLAFARGDHFAEAAQYYTGLMLGFEHEYETARDTLTALAEADPSSPYTNDAIEFAWIIEEGLKGEQDVLARFMDAMRFALAGDPDAVTNALTPILQLHSDTPLRIRAIMKMGETYEKAGRYNQAVRIYEQFLKDYPTDIQRPDIHRRIASVYERGEGNIEMALETYETILMSYPYYIFLDEIRSDVTRLRGTLDEMGELH